MPQSSSDVLSLVSRNAYRIVLFGLPGAGKSSLLGALARSAEVQENILGGKLIDRAQGLHSLERNLYENRPIQTEEELAPFPIVLEPPPSKSSLPPTPTEAVLYDCDGRVANELLAGKDGLTSDSADRALARAVLDADVLVLPVDVSAELPQLKSDFAQFAAFMRILEQSRGQRAEVAGLPVFLVLTKCDLLVKPGDTSAAWIDRIEDKKREVHQRFQEFLAEEAERNQQAFGKIDLHVWATAIKRPALAGAQAQPNEPFGVAELFRQCFDSAADFRGRCRRATQRLAWTLGVVLSLVGFMVLLGLFFLESQRETELVRFEKELKSVAGAHDDSAAERLREPLGKTIANLETLKDNPLFDKMPPALRQNLLEQLKEATAYDKFSKDWQATLKALRLRESPRFAQNDAELNAFRKALELVQPPSQYQVAWHDTEIVRRQRQWADEIEVMESEIKAAVKAITELQEIDAKLKDRGKYLGKELDQFLEELKLKDRLLPYRSDNRAPVRNSRVTYSNVAQFATVAVLLAQYEKNIRAYYKLGEAK